MACVTATCCDAPQTLTAKGQTHLVERLSKNIGFGMGLEFRESATVLNAKNTTAIKAGMVFNVCLGVAGLENPDATDPKLKTYALQVSN